MINYTVMFGIVCLYVMIGLLYTILLLHSLEPEEVDNLDKEVQIAVVILGTVEWPYWLVKTVKGIYNRVKEA